MSTELKVTTPESGVATNVADDAAAQEAVARAANGGAPVMQLPVGSPAAAALTAPEQTTAASLLAKAKTVAKHPVTTHIAAGAGAILLVAGYEFVAAKQDWPRLGVFGDKKSSKR